MPSPDTTVRSVPALRLRELLDVFKDSYISHLLLPSLLVCVLAKLSSGSGIAVGFVFLGASALLVSAAHRALTRGHLFAELSFRRAFFRAVIIAALIGLFLSLTIAVFAPLLFFLFLAMGAELAPIIDFDPRTAGGRFVLVGISLGGLYCLLRLWPVYVVQYILRDSPADLWKETWHIKFPDAGIAWRLTGVEGALWNASSPVFIGIVLISLYYLALSGGFLQNGLGKVVLEGGFYFGLLPFVHLMIVERAMQLAGVSEKAFAQAMGIAEAGTLWFADQFEPVSKPESEEEEQGWVGRYRDPGKRARLIELLGIDDRQALVEIEAALIGVFRFFRGLDPATGASPQALSSEERAALAEACWPVLRRQRPLEYRRINREMRERGGPYEKQCKYIHALYLAAELLQQADPSRSLYHAKKLCLTAYKTLYDASAFHLVAEDRLCWLGEEVSAPTIDSRFRKLLNLKDVRYWQHPLYQELYSLPAEDLPDGAMLALFPFVYVNVHSRAFEMEDILPVMDILKRYQVRLYPAVVAYLQTPQKYPPKDPHTVYSRPLFELIATWPQRYAEPLFRSAFASGWNEAAQLMPQADWAEALIQEFAESPYGPPRLPESARR